jgi:hypothetical protein
MHSHKAGTSSIGSIAARIAVLGLLALALVAPSHATTISLKLTGDINNSDVYPYYTYTYTDIYGNTHTEGEYTGPYPATVSGGSYGTGQGIFVMCYDINMEAFIGETYTGIMVMPTTVPEIEAAYLQSKLATYEDPTPDGGFGALLSVSGPISMAVWQLMAPSSQVPTPKPFGLGPAAAAWVAEADNAYLSGNWTQADADEYAFWMPTPINMTQRFGFVYGQPPQPSDITTPEPGSLVMFLLGGVLLAAGKIHS